MDSEVEALGHKLGEWQTVKEASCEETGRAKRDCGRCEYFETKEVEATGHAYEAVVTAPTCEEGGYTTHICSACGDNYVDSEVEALGHNYTDGVCVECGALGVSGIFGDVSDGAWYNVYVQYVYDKGLMSGSNGMFNPTKDVTRAQLVTTLYRLAGEPEVTDRSALEAFSDLKDGQYYTDAICWAYNTGVGTGNNGKFDVTGKLTRQQMAAFLFRFAGLLGYDTEAKADYSDMLNADQVSGYAKEAVSWAVGSGLISGSQKTDTAGNIVYNLNPRGNTTRAQLSAILQRFCEGNSL